MQYGITKNIQNMFDFNMFKASKYFTAHNTITHYFRTINEADVVLYNLKLQM